MAFREYKLFSRLGNIHHELARFIHKTHYDILGLQRNCSEDEIKKAFIVLSKIHHPDKSNDNSHDSYVKIIEAYRILGKKQARLDYDLSLPDDRSYTYVETKSSGSNIFHPNRPFVDPYSDPTFYKNRKWSDSQNENSDSFYGFKGIKRMSNGRVALVIVGLAIFLGILKTIWMNALLNIQKEKTAKQSIENAKIYSKVRADAIKSDNNDHLERIETLHRNNERR